MKLRYIDLPKTFVIDWMHAVLLGVVKTVLSMWCDSTYKGRPFYIGDKVCMHCHWPYQIFSVYGVAFFKHILFIFST